MKRLAPTILVAAMLAVLAGCSTPPKKSDGFAMHPEVARARAMFVDGRATEAMIACIDLARRDPDMEGLRYLQSEIMTEMSRQRAKALDAHKAASTRRMDDDTQQLRTLPSSYGVRRYVDGEDVPLKTAPSKLDGVLHRSMSAHFEGVDLNQFVSALGMSENINIVAGFDTGKTMTVQADDITLAELLDYASRNLGVTFYVGENAIWATPQTEAVPTAPLETRMYRIHKGDSTIKVSQAPSGSPSTGAGASEPAEYDRYESVLEAIKRFVPTVEGADYMFDMNAHVLIARNTRSNLAKVEELIEALDVVPPQVLIEARFISTEIEDLRELGVDWILNTPVAVTRKSVLRNGQTVDDPATLVDPGTISPFVTAFPEQAETLSLSYRGVLTDPMFQAILHALDSSGKARTLSVPRVTTVNNREALIHVGREFLYFSEFDVVEVILGTDSNGNAIYGRAPRPVGRPDTQDLGIALQVTPSLGSDMRSITLALQPSITDLVDWNVYGGSPQTTNVVTSGNNNSANSNQADLWKLPIFSTSKIRTKLVVGSGETVVMGGLVKAGERKVTRRVPFISALPLVGRLFTHEAIEETQQNLLIFVTASIISERGEQLVPVSNYAARQPAAQAN